MKKILLGVFTIVVALLLASPAIVGWVLEDQLNAQIKTANQNPNISIEKQQYRRGWLTSRVEYKITIKQPEGNTEIAAEIDVHHGPLPVSVLAVDGIEFKPSILIAEADVLLRQLAVNGIESPEQLPPLRLLSTVNFNQSVAYQCSHPGGQLAFTRPSGTNALLRWGKGNCDGTASMKDGVATGAVNTAGLVFKDGQTDLQSAELATEFSIDTSSSGERKTGTKKVAGFTNSRIASLNGRIKYGDVVDSIAGDDLLLKGQILPAGEMLDATLQLSAATFSLRDFELNNGLANVSVNNLPQAIFGSQSSKEKSTGGNVDGSADTSPPLRLALASAELRVPEISGTLKQGTFMLSANADLHDLENNMPLTLESVLQSLRGSVDGIADEPLLGYALSNYAAPRIGNLWYASTASQRELLRQEIQNSQQKKLVELLQTGWLKAEGERFRSNIEYSNGQLVVNSIAIHD